MLVRGWLAEGAQRALGCSFHEWTSTAHQELGGIRFHKLLSEG